MQIHVKTPTGQWHTLVVEPWDTVDTLKGVIEDIDGAPMSEQRITFEGQQLADGHTLADYNIQEDSALTLHAEAFADRLAMAGFLGPPRAATA